MQAQAEMEHSQAEYVKGVSNWNFDVAALKASAAAEGPGLAPVPEGGVPMGAPLPLLPLIHTQGLLPRGAALQVQAAESVGYTSATHPRPYL
jgi:hypothetical protein